MPTAVVMPKLGMTMQEGTVIDWPIAIGGAVSKGDVVLVIESEKAEVEVEATASGYFRHVFVPPDEVVPCGTVLAALTDTPDEVFDAEAFRAAQAGPAPSVTAGGAGATSAAAVARRETTAPRAGAPATPAAKRLAREHDVDLDAVAGTGPEGRITREDVEAVLERRASLIRVADGVSLDVPAQGPEDGDPVLLVPGFGTDASVFARQIPVLAERYRVRGVNPRGVGLSDAPEAESYRIETGAADLAALIDAPAHVIGTSLGSAMALELALTNPDKVRTLTLVAPLVRARARLLAVIDAWCALGAALDSQALAATLLPWLFSEEFLADDTRRKRTSRGLAQTLSRTRPEALVRWANGLRAWSGSRESALAGIDVPTLVVVAGEDLLTPGGEAVAAAIPKSRRVAIAGAGHAVMLESPEAVDAAVLEHLSGAR